MEQKGLSQEDIIRVAISIAELMFRTDRFGLEAPVHELSELLSDERVEGAVDVLVFAHLGRLGSGLLRRFSFVHRRFNEYFLVQKLRQEPNRVPLQAIPTDSRFRDALALFCEVADETMAKDISRFAWRQVLAGDLASTPVSAPEYLAAVHSLRFLSDAFRGRQKCLEEFSVELADYIDNVISRADSLLAKKLALEAVGLLDQDRLGESLILATHLNNPWIDETAFRSCQYVSDVSEDLQIALKEMLQRIPDIPFLLRYPDLIFSLSMIDPLRRVRSFCRFRLSSIIANAAGFLLLLAS